MFQHHRFIAMAANIIVFIIALAQSAILPFPATLPSVSQSYDSILLKTWGGIKKRNIDAYTVPLVHRPKSEIPDDAVSEGVGYGLFCALYCNDQTYFNKIWDAAEQYMWSAGSYNWRVDKNGTVIGSGPASDAEEDIACALIFADQLVKRKVWQPHTSSKSASYAARAQSMVENFWNNLVESGKYLRPGNNWGGSAFVNPGYFAPAYYRVFNEFDSTRHDWTGLIDQCYRSVALSPGANIGLVPDWMKPDGTWPDSSSLGYNSYAGGRYCYKDGIRVLWRLATDYQWYGEGRARTFLDKSMSFVKSADRANFYQMNGAAVTDSFKLGNGVTRPRSEHNHLTLGMWAAAAMASGASASADSFSSALLGFYTPGADFFGKAFDSLGEDTLHNEMYFDQFLAWFGASLISGIFTDLWEDLKDTNISIPLQWKSTPVFSGSDIDANVNPLKVFGVFSKSARWTILIKQEAGDSSVVFSGTCDTVSVAWYGLTSAGRAMPAGWYDITITAKGLTGPVAGSCWLGRSLDLMISNRLLVDDFSDHDLVPFIGALWRNYLDSYEGHSGKSTVPVFGVQGSDTAAYVRWSFLLNGSSSLGYNPYAALEWNCQMPDGNLDLTGLDTVVIVAKALSPMSISTQLITSDITDYTYFEDSVALTAQWKEFRLPVKNFKRRLNGGSGSPSLSKMTAIRFQVQSRDGTTDEIDVKKMMFSGSLGPLYQSPPPYVPQINPVRRGAPLQAAAQALRAVKKENGRVCFFLPANCKSGKIRIVDTKGNVVRNLPVSSNVVWWNGLDNAMARVRSGIYLASISVAGKTACLKIPFSSR